MTAAEKPLKAPFPYPGGKAKVADTVWERFGDVDNAVEPFMGSMAWLLRRPAEHFSGGYRVETANDVNHYVANFWRAVAADPVAVARWADWPVLEADMHARHKWLVRSQTANDFRRWMAEDPGHFDAKVAGWWVWGQCCWIGGAWCNDGFVGRAAMPQLDAPHGRHAGRRDTAHKAKMPNLGQECGTGGVGVHGVGGRPQLADTFDVGRGVNGGAAVTLKAKRPTKGNGHNGSLPGVLGSSAHQKVPNFAGGNATTGHDIADPSGSTAGMCNARREWLTDWMQRLADRLRLVRTCYGHWSRVCDSDSTLTRLGTTGVFLDPPYPANRADTGEKSRDANLYATDKHADLNALRDEVLAWCRKWGDHRLVRAAVCCYEGDGYEPLAAAGWDCVAWEASGGYGNQRKGRGKSANAKRERIWFSPHCLKPGHHRTLFDGVPA